MAAAVDSGVRGAPLGCAAEAQLAVANTRSGYQRVNRACSPLIQSGHPIGGRSHCEQPGCDGDAHDASERLRDNKRLPAITRAVVLLIRQWRAPSR